MFPYTTSGFIVVVCTYEAAVVVWGLGLSRDTVVLLQCKLKALPLAGQRPATSRGCSNILLPVKVIYNVPTHIPLSAVSNLHLQEPFGGGGGGWIGGFIEEAMLECQYADS